MPRPAPDQRGVISYPGYQVAIARQGDTVASIAARLGLNAAELAGYNAIRATTVLNPGAVVAYLGDLGMGKTAFTRGLAAGLGYKGRVTSPTFAIVNEYEGGWLPLFHFDMYRLNSADDLFDIGWEDYLARGGVCAVEWSERAEDAFDGSTVRIDFRRGAQHDGWRVITITGVDGL